MKKRILTIALIVALLATCFAGTFAYLTDTESAHNTMTYGNVAIEQTEMERKPDVAFNAELTADMLQPFTQGQKIYPAVRKGNDYELTQDKANGIKWGNTVSFEGAWSTIFNPASVANAMDKFVFVENTGSEALYFRTIIAVECPEGWTVDHCSNGDDIGVYFGGQYNCDGVGTEKIGDVNYAYFAFTYKDGRTLPSGYTAHPSLLQLALHHELDNEDMSKIGDTLDVHVLTQAVQAQGFDNMNQALTAAFGEFTLDNAVAWMTPVITNTNP